MKRNILITILLALSLNMSAQGTKHLSDYINTSIGAIDRRGSNCVIGPRTPYSSISPSPQTPKGGMDGYNPKEPIMGFGQMHVSGTGWSTYGHFLVSPQSGELHTALDDHLSPHSSDITKAYYYATHLDKYNIDVQLSPAHHSAMYQFTFRNKEQGHILFDAAQAIASDIAPEMNGKVKHTSTSVDANNKQVTMKLTYEGGWPSGPVTLYCVTKYESNAVAWGTWKGTETFDAQKVVSTDNDPTHAGAFLTFDTNKNPTLRIKTAISFISAEHAVMLMDKDINGWDFQTVCDNARRAWDDRLSSIQISTNSEDLKTMFYSSLFRVFTAISDRSADNHYAPESRRPFFDDNYAYWDTFRSLYPLLMLVDHQTVSGNINTVIDIFKRDGEVHDGFVAGRSRHGDQGGNDIDHMLAEACLKNIPGVNWEDAYAVVKHNADNFRIGYKENKTSDYRTMNYIPERSMSCSQTLEFAYNDYSAALMAKKLGHKDDYNKYLKRSHNWQNLWNPDLEDRGYTGFIDARREDGTFCNFPVAEYGGSWDKPFYEGISWLYSFYTPHDFKTLIKIMGGKKHFAERLAFGIDKGLVEISNEPGFLCTFAFHHADRPDLSSYWAHRIANKGYDLTGYPGNDDTGSMTSWFVFVNLGLFPNAGQDFYYIIAPAVDEAVLALSNGKTLTIRVNNNAGSTRVKECRLNGKRLKNLIISHKDLMKGGTLEFELDDTN